jgi:hypothetical protein
MGTYLLVVFALCLATEAITELVIKSVIFKGFRELASRGGWLKELFSCGYCFSVWVALGLIASVPVVILPLSDWAFVNVLITLLIIHRGSNIIHNIIDKWTDKYYDMRFINTDKGLGKEI